MKKFLSFLLLPALLLSLVVRPVVAAVQGDPGQTGAFGGVVNPLTPNVSLTDARSGAAFTRYFVYFWRVIIVFGMLSVLLIFIMGAFDWMNAGGDKGKVDSGRQKMVNAVIGAILLVGTFAILQFIGKIFGFSILNLNITPLIPTGTGGNPSFPNLPAAPQNVPAVPNVPGGLPL